MKIFFLIYCHNKNRIFWIQQLFCNLQPLLHKRQPLTMPICISPVNIIIIVFPIPCARVVRRININTVHFSCIKIFQQLQSMIIIRLNQCMPQIAVWSITYIINQLQIWIDWFSKLSHAYQLIHQNFFSFFCHLVITYGYTILDVTHFIHITDGTGLLRNRRAAFYRNIIKRCTLRQMFFKHQPKFLRF